MNVGGVYFMTQFYYLLKTKLANSKIPLAYVLGIFYL